MSKTLTVKVRGSFESFTSELSDARALEILENAGTRGELSTFGTSLVKQAHAWGARPLSGPQMAWVHKLALEFVAKSQPAAAAAPAAAEVEGGMQAIVELLTTAGERLKWPAITYGGLRISLAGPKHPGCVNVTSDAAAFADRVWYGRITAGGSFVPVRPCPATVATLVELASDPKGKTAAEGKATGSCCFCRRALETAESLAVGYGPVCADKYALPWGFPKAKRAPKAKPAAIVAPVAAPAVVELPHGTEETDGEPAVRCTRCGAAWAATGAQACVSCERGVQAGLFRPEAPKPVQGAPKGMIEVAPGVWRRAI